MMKKMNNGTNKTTIRRARGLIRTGGLVQPLILAQHVEADRNELIARNAEVLAAA